MVQKNDLSIDSLNDRVSNTNAKVKFKNTPEINISREEQDIGFKNVMTQLIDTDQKIVLSNTE